MEIFDILTIDYDKQRDILDIPEQPAWTRVNQITGDRPAGLYEYGLSFTYNFADTNDSALMRYSLDGGVNWDEYRHEPNDQQNVVPRYYAFPQTFAGGPFELLAEFSKTAGGAQLDVKFADMWIRRIG